MKTWRVLPAVLLACLAGAAWAAAPFARVELQGRQPVLVGRQVHLDVTVLAPNYFTSAPVFPPLAVPGAIVTMPDESGHNAVETIGGATYAAIRKTYVFAAQQEGEFALPPVKIAFTYGGDDGRPRQGSVTLPPFKIKATLPAGAAAAASAAGGVLPVARVTLTQRFDPDPGKGALHVDAGAAVVRTVEAYAAQTQAMMIPPPKVQAPTGVRVFAADPRLDDIVRDREGLVGGKRVDQLTYVFEKAGQYALPAIEIAWFDPASGRRQVARAPGVQVEVAPQGPGAGTIAPEPPAGTPGAVTRRGHASWRAVGGGLAAGAVLVLPLWWALRWLRPRLRRWRAAWSDRQRAARGGEPALFQALLAACRARDAARTYGALLDWSRRGLPADLEAWSAAHASADLRRELECLRETLFASPSAGGWQPDVLARELRDSRDAWLRGRRAAARAWRLPALNP